jgi:nicotinamidase-related amidase
MVLVDYQAGLAFAAGSADRQGIRSAALALAKTAVAFSVPVVASTSATKVYSGPLMPPLRALLTDVVPIERRNMNLWEDEAAKAAVVATGRRTLVVAGS